MFVPIGIFQSQVSATVPNDYRAISIENLRSSVEAAQSRDPNEQATRVKSAFYDVRLVGQTLLSERSIISIEKDSAESMRCSLGNVNLAISAPKNRLSFPIDTRQLDTNDQTESKPRLESAPSGELFAVLPGESTTASILFGWSLRGKQNGIYRDYELALPLSPQSQIVISVPSETVLTTENGVLRSWPSPPPGADVGSRSNDVKWYTIEAGGLASNDAGGLSIIRLRVSNEKDDLNAAAFVVREESRRYTIDNTGVNWWHAMRIQSQGRRQIPELELARGVVTSVRVANDKLGPIGFGLGVERRFTTTQQADGSTVIRVNEPLYGEASDSVASTVTIRGKSSWDEVSGWCDLPTTRWIDPNVIDAHSTSKVQVTVAKPLSVVGWELPKKWTQQPEQNIATSATTQPGSVLLQGEGPPLSHNVVDAVNDIPDTEAWSRIRLTNDSAITSSAHLLQLKIISNERRRETNPRLEIMEAKSRLELVIDPNRADPIPLKIEPNWNLQSITLMYSGRVVESLAVDRDRTLYIWPEPGDAVGRSLVIETRGTRNLQMAPGKTDIPATRFLQVVSARSDTIAVVVPPTEFDWAGDTSLHGQRFEPSTLSDDQIVFFDSMTQDSLLFRPDANATPPLSLQLPGVSVDVSTSLKLQRFGDEIMETLSISAQSTNHLSKEIYIDTGPASSRPAYRWSLRSDDDSLPINLPDTTISLSDEGVYNVPIGESSMRNRRLVGSRQYKLDSELLLQCPRVTEPPSQNTDDPGIVISTVNAQVFLGPGLQLNQRDPSVVQLVPVETEVSVETEASAANQLGADTDPQEIESDTESVENSAVPGRAKTTDSELDDSIRLRYDAAKKPQLIIQKTDLDPSPSIVWQHELEVTASSSGTDLIRGLFRVSSSRPIQIDYESEVELASISHNGDPIDLNAISQRPIILTPKTDSDVIRVLWTRDTSESSWIRRCQIPQIEMQGVLLKSSYQLTPSVDTFAIASLLHTSSQRGFGMRSIDVVADTELSLAPRNLAIAIGWLIAAIMFILTWFAARRSLLFVAMAVTLASFAAVLWWPWQLAIVGWCIMPALAAALLETSVRWLNPESILETPVANQSDVENDANGSQSQEFSLINNLFLGLLIFAIVSMGTALTNAQDTPNRFINILVPIDKNARQVGDKVYIPVEFYQQLFDTDREEAPSPVLVESAIYRVDLESVRDSVVAGIPPTITAEFQISPQRPSNRIQLPFPKNVVDRIELNDGDQDRIFLAEADTATTSIVTLPSGDAFRLQVTLMPQVNSTNVVKTLELDIPKVGAARVLVEADRSIESVDVIGSRGAVSKQLGLRRWEADLGPVQKLTLRYQESIDNVAKQDPRLVRRYLINAGKNRTSIDCQIEPPQATQVGDSIQLVVLDASMPAVTSAAWRLESSEMITASRRLITLTRRSGVANNNDGSADASESETPPIHLLWSIDSVVNDLTSLENSVPISIPDVIPPASGAYDPAWIAVQHDTDIQVMPLRAESVTALAETQFRSKWSGTTVQGEIDQAFLCTDDLPPLLLSQAASEKPTTESVAHHLHVTNDHLQLRFQATIVPGRSGVQRNTLRVPKDLELIRVTLNGQPINRELIQSEQYNEIPLGDVSGANSIIVEALGLQKRSDDSAFSLPAVELWPSASSEGTYTLTHSDDVRLKVLRQPKGMSPLSLVGDTNNMLASGWIPKATWAIDDQTVAPVVETYGGLIQARPRKVVLKCDESIRMNYKDGEWSMRTEIRFDKSKVTDFVDVEIPTRWCKDLVIGPPTNWTQQQSTDPDLQVIRIASDPQVLATVPLVITSELNTSDQGRIDVPRVRVLGAKSQIRVTVPNRLTNEPIEWIAKPVSSRTDLTDASFSTYTFENTSAWSIEMAPLSDAITDPVALASDAQVFLQNDKTLLICRWDVVPNRLNSVVVRLPKSATCLGAWAAGRPVRVQEVDTPQNGDSASVRIPLSLTRLAQSVEVLLSVPTLNAKRADYLPELREILVPDQWVSVYTPSSSSSNNQATWNQLNKKVYGMSQRRAIGLASVVVEAINQSLDTLAERPANEVATWLLPWVSRYRNIAASASHSFQFKGTETGSSELETAIGDPDRVDVMSVLGQLTDENSQAHAQLWRILDRRMQGHINRLLDDGHIDQLNKFDPLFDAGQYQGYRLTDVTKITPAISPRPIQSMSAGMHDLRQFLINFLTLAMVTGMLVIFKPFRSVLHRLSIHPAFWLCLVGCFGLLVAPIPVAIAVIFVSLTLPWWSSEPTTTS